MSGAMMDVRVCEMGRRARRRRATLRAAYDVGASRRSGRESRLLMADSGKSLRRIRAWIAVMVLGLLVSGLTAFPLQHEVAWMHGLLSGSPLADRSGLLPWIARVDEGLMYTAMRYPFLAYGTDWLAFAHLVLAALFIGPWMDPVRNKWVFAFGVIACAGVLPLALIAAPLRSVPFGWRLIDCSFGVFGCVPMLLCLREVRRIEQAAE